MITHGTHLLEAKTEESVRVKESLCGNRNSPGNIVGHILKLNHVKMRAVPIVSKIHAGELYNRQCFFFYVEGEYEALPYDAEIRWMPCHKEPKKSHNLRKEVITFLDGYHEH
jgi:hypothetical protein